MIAELPTASCTGCGACVTICPRYAISMVERPDGFVYPSIDSDLCVGCGQCMKACHALGHEDLFNQPMACYAAQNDKKDVLEKSTSGGVFQAFCEAVLSENGVVYGCTYDPDYHAVITRAEAIDQIAPMRGSKYVWSDARSSYPEVKKDLATGGLVLYTGLPCQIAGLRKYLGEAYDNLYAVDMLCGGAPSPYAFQRYLETITDQAGKKTLNFQFRDKAQLGSGVHCTYFVDGKKHTEDYAENSFYYAFSSKSRLTWRTSCYSCDYKGVSRVSDLTIGDYWGVENHHAAFLPKEGVSVILVNTDQGMRLFEKVKNSLRIEESRTEYVIEKNSLVHHAEEAHIQIPAERESFFQLIREKGWSAADKRYLASRQIILRKRKKSRLIRKLMKILRFGK